MTAEAATPKAEGDNCAGVIAIEVNLAEREKAVRKSFTNRVVNRFAASNCISRVMFTNMRCMGIRINEADVGAETKLREIRLLKAMDFARCGFQFQSLAALVL